MKIIFYKNDFEYDHSSTSYDFFAVEGKLTKPTKEFARKFSSRAEVRGSTASYIWHGEYDGLSDEDQNELLRLGYHLMVKESYEWWTFKISIPFDKGLFKDLKHFNMTGEEDLGVDIERYKGLIIISIYAYLEAGGFEGIEDELEIVREEIMNENYRFLYELLEFYEGDELAALPKELIGQHTEAETLIGALEHV